MLALKLKLLKSRMVGYTRLMLGFCKNEAETRQRHRETVKMEKTAKAHIQTHFSSRRGCLGDIIMFNTRSETCKVAIGIKEGPLRASPSCGWARKWPKLPQKANFKWMRVK